MIDDSNAIVEALKLELDEVKAENLLLQVKIDELAKYETQKNLLEMDNLELQHKVSELQLTISSLKEAMDGMAEDMGLLEVRIMELTGND